MLLMNVDEIRHYVKNGCRQHREVKSTKFLKCHHLSIPSLSIGRNHHDVKNIIVADVTNIILAEIFSCSVYLFKLFSMLDIISKMTKNVLDASSPIMASFGMISMSSF